METAMERYRTNRTYAPSGTGTSTTYSAAPAAANATPLGPTVTQPAAPVKTRVQASRRLASLATKSWK